MSIKVENITKEYGSQKALDQVSFEIRKGEIVGFLGPNGAGKSTMMKIITCFIPQSEGQVEVCGHDVEKKPMDVKKMVGYLPEHNPLYLEMYVREYLEFVAGLHKVSKVKERVNEMITLVGLEVEQHKKIGALSKGYRQRVGLAQALIHDPEVLILDEPTTGLDPNQIEEIRSLILRIGQEKTVMMSTHIMQEVEAICGRVIIINKGKIVADEAVDSLMSQREGQVVIEVEFSEKVEQSQLSGLPGVVEASTLSGNKWRIVAEQDVRDALFQFSIQQKISVLTLKKEEQKLEDVFKFLTTKN